MYSFSDTRPKFFLFLDIKNNKEKQTALLQVNLRNSSSRQCITNTIKTVLAVLNQEDLKLLQGIVWIEESKFTKEGIVNV